jgi:hypothetical protein
LPREYREFDGHAGRSRQQLMRVAKNSPRLDL